MGTPHLFNAELQPNFDGGLLRAKYLKGGVRNVKTLSQRNAIPNAYRYLDLTESTIVFVEDEGKFYKLINNPAGTTTNSDWEMVVLGGISTFTPVGTWDSNNLAPVLSDAGAVGLNGQFYFVVNTPTPTNVTDPTLFLGVTTEVVDGDMIVSIGSQWIAVSNATTWDSLAKPSVIDDYVAGIVQAHTHVVADITDLNAYLAANYIPQSQIVNSAIPWGSTADSDIVDVEFLRTWYYTAAQVDFLLGVPGSFNFTDLADAPSSYTGQALKVVRVKATEDGLEFATGGSGGGHDIYTGVGGAALTTRANLRFQNGLYAADSAPDSVVRWGGVLTEDVNIDGPYSIIFGDLTNELTAFGATISGGGGINTSLSLSGGVLSISAQNGGDFTTIGLIAGSTTIDGTTSINIGNTDAPIINIGNATATTNIVTAFNDIYSVTANSTTGYISFDASSGTGAGIDLFGGSGANGATFRMGITAGQSFKFTNSGSFIVDDQRVTPRGIEYNADYSATFISRSLVDKAYVDAAIAGAAAWSLASGGTLTGVNTITSNAANQLNFAGTWTASASGQYAARFAGVLTTRNTNNDELRGYEFSPSMAVNGGAPTGQLLTAFFLNPTFTGTATYEPFGVRYAGFTQPSARALAVYVAGQNTTVSVGQGSLSSRLDFVTSGGSARIGFATGSGHQIYSNGDLSIAGSTNSIRYTFYPNGSGPVSGSVEFTAYRAGTASSTGTQVGSYPYALMGHYWDGAAAQQRGFYIGSSASVTTNLLGKMVFGSTVTTGSAVEHMSLWSDGRLLISNTGADTPTANTKLDVRGIGTGTDLVVRLADSSNGLIWRVQSDKTIIRTLTGTISETWNTAGLSVTKGATEQYGNSFTSYSGASYSAYYQLSTMSGMGMGLIYLATLTGTTTGSSRVVSIDISTNPASAASGRYVGLSVGEHVGTWLNQNNWSSMSLIALGNRTVNGELNASSGSASFRGIDITQTYNITGGTWTLYGIDYNPTTTSMTGVTHYAFRSTSGGFYAQHNNLGATQANLSGIWIANNTAAVNNGQQWSPSIVIEGQGWKANATAGSQSAQFKIYVVPIQGAANPVPALAFDQFANGVSSGGSIYMHGGGINFANNSSGTGGIGFGNGSTPNARGSASIYHSGNNMIFTNNTNATGIIDFQSAVASPSSGTWVGYKFTPSTTPTGTAVVQQVSIQGSFAPSLNTITGTVLNLAPVVSPTGGTNHVFYGIDYNPSGTFSNIATHLAVRTTSGQLLFANSSGDAVTANTRLDVRGIGTTTALGLRIADSGNTNHFSVADNGAIVHYTNLNLTGSTQNVFFSNSGNNQTNTTTSGALVRIDPDNRVSTGSTRYAGLLVTPYYYHGNTGELSGIDVAGDTDATFLASLNAFRVSTTINSSSGTGTIIGAKIGPTYNFTGTHSSDVYGIYYTPTETSMTGVNNHYSFAATSGTMLLPASVVARAPLRIPHGTAPTSPVDGDIWTTSTSMYVRINGVTKDLNAGGGGGITNSAAANEMMKSDGTNAVPSGVFSTTAGDLTFGTGLTGANRTITADGSATDVGFIFSTKGAGEISLVAITNLGTSSIAGDRTIKALSSSTDAHLEIQAKGAGTVRLVSSTTYLGNSALSGVSRTLEALGSGTDIDLNLKPKGASLVYAYNGLNVMASGVTNRLQISADEGTGPGILPVYSSGTVTSPFGIYGGTGISGSVTGQDIRIRGGNGYATGNNNGGNTYISYGAKANTGKDGNVGLLADTLANWQSMERGLFVLNALTAPTGNPSGGIFSWIESGTDWKWRDVNGNVYSKVQAGLKTVVLRVSSSTAIGTGLKGYAISPLTGTIKKWYLRADPSATVTVDVWKANGSHPTNSNSITASAKPALSAAAYGSSSTLTGWSTSVSEGDIFAMEVETNDNATDIELVLYIQV